MKWTSAQQKVIDTRNKNVLVSAAAGSGKTAVLVERIISMITQGENPLDIDHLLVVTFTNAAAAEMRTRIGKAIDEKLRNEPDNTHLQRQMSLLQSAQITTIHSFCLNVIRNYFYRIDLDPSFKIAEESEITLMKSDVIADVLERWYEEGREDFHEFIESYSRSKSDEPIEDLILKLYDFSMSNPWPKKWLRDMEEFFSVDSMEDLTSTIWMKELIQYVGVIVKDLKKINQRALEICGEAGGPSAYSTALLSDRNILQGLEEASSYHEYAEIFQGISYARLSNKRDDTVLGWKKDQVKALREVVKKGIKDLTNQYFYQAPDEMLKDLMAVRKVMRVLFELTLDFMEEFAKKKEEKNLIDFNDLEHFSLEILVEEKDGQLDSPTQAALEISEQFDEILIDEYQDSNLVQETILKSISRERLGKPNRFMVGDVKQSIYKFRLAMPELFMDKYNNYAISDYTEDGQGNLYQRIDLDRNFRSRKSVLDYVNLIFKQIMTQPVGGIVYDEAASLKYGELFEETLDQKEKEVDGKEEDGKEEEDILLAQDVELLLVTEEESLSEDDFSEIIGQEFSLEAEEIENEDLDEALYTKKELEARAIARKIRELTDSKKGLYILDKSSRKHRPVEYKDIVILLRSMAGWAEVFVNTLMQEGIPAYAETGTGYFRTVEIMTLLNMLKIIDNPIQDIPLFGVLYSPIVGLTTTELAMIRVHKKNCSIYTAVTSYIKEGQDEEIRGKLIGFFDLLENFRSMVNHVPINELLLEVLEQTGYYYYVCAMPGGDRRKANIDMLVSLATRFEKGSYRGLFHFIRYIEKLHKYEVDFGEASTSGEQDNTVRIMSIHKSKGLEFPVVFVAGMSKQFNTQDLRNSIVLHNEYGVGPDYIDIKLRTKVPTLLKKVIQKKIQIENLGEELRVLYVALTRAREKLILTGYLKSREDIHKKDFTFFDILSAKSYLDWVLPAMVNYMDSNRIKEDRGNSNEDISVETSKELWINHENKEDLVDKDLPPMGITIIGKDILLKEEIKKQIFLQNDKECLRSLDPTMVYNKELREEINTRLKFTYPYEAEANLRVKMTVSELKKLGQFFDEEESVFLFEDDRNSDHHFISGIDEPRLKSKSDLVENPPVPDKDADLGASVENETEAVVETDVEAMAELVIEPEFIPTIPSFLKDEKEKTLAADRGTIYHTVLELLDLKNTYTWKDLENEFQRLLENHLVKEADLQRIRKKSILKFLQSSLADRMRKASEQGKLFKEKQFVIGRKAKELFNHTNSEELILIQGIIDVFFEEDGQLVLVDYKSDKVETPELLIHRYQVQLDYYKKALEQMFHKKVKETLIYSLYLEKVIRID